MTGRPTLVTGASGFAGRHVLAHLAATLSGTPLHAWSRSAQSDIGGVSWRRVNITGGPAVREAIAASKPARIVHLAGSPHVGESWRSSVPALETNVIGTHHLLDAVRMHCPDCRVLVVTSAMVYRASDAALDEDAPLEPSSPYGLSKLAQDDLALRATEDDGLDVVVARPFNHIGPGQEPTFALSSFARQIALIEAGLAPPHIKVGNLDAERDFTDVRDVADAYARILHAGVRGRAYNVCSDVPYRIGELLDRLIEMARVTVARQVDPDRLRPSDVPRLLGNGSRLRAELGWVASRTIGDTLADTLEGWRVAVASGRVTA